MTPQKRLLAPLSLFAASALLLSGCAIESGNSSQPTGEAQVGGTLKVGSNGDNDHLDPALITYVPTQNFVRATNRQLLNYESSTDENTRIQVKADLAEEVPEATNDGKTYTFTIKEGANWDTPDGPRQIVADDVVRGFKRLCNPYRSSPLLGYFQSLLTGMDEYCAGFAKVKPLPKPMAEYINSAKLPGVRAVDERTVEFNLNVPAGDFLYMLTLATASPAPEEVLDYLPDSPEYRKNFISSGPYTVGEYTADKSLKLVRNDAWKPETDTLRHAYVDSIEMTMGLSADAVTQQMQAGTLDMSFDTGLAPSVAAQMAATKDPNFSTMNSGAVNPFLWINEDSPSNGGALADKKVREAIQYATDKASVVQTLGGDSVAKVQNGIFGPGVLGFHDFDLYPTPDHKGDPEKAKQLLAEAGYPQGITLKMPYRNKDIEPQIAQTLQAGFEKASIKIELIPVSPTDYYTKYLTNHESTKAGKWDIAPMGWSPDWQGGAARSVFQPLYTYNGTENTFNLTDYDNKEADKLAAQAVQESDQAKAQKLWEQVDETVMGDSIVVPVAAPTSRLYHSKRVQNFQPYAMATQGDWTNVWLQD
ncbi:ABC transporter substrate-binding protein [Glutamicibacter sp.]|uniref:ABC transporter substrate-binding protein n=1 Tax=Glutamicibacter sp. TaxID=1931995 RepID=UPI0028BEF017|nr:ABC transporter substrate-binding protein [Glutamicibacter sp.]